MCVVGGWMGGRGAAGRNILYLIGLFSPLLFQFCLILSAKISCCSWFHVLNSLNNNNLLVHSRTELRLGFFFFFFLFILWETEWMQSQWRSPKKLWHPLKRLFKNPNLLRKCLGPHTHMTAEADFTVFCPRPGCMWCDMNNKKQNFNSETLENVARSS